jgi:hypothetical protein
MVSLAEVFRRHWPAYVQEHGEKIPGAHVRAAQAILRCRTPEAGMVFYRCLDCGRTEAAPVSCGHRACNLCGQHKAAAWEARQKARLLPVPCHMVTFTLPSEFRDLFRRHQRHCYDLFLKESAAALMDLAADPQHLGGQIGMTGVLQTWTRDLRYHPHIHYLVPAGALADTAWVRLKNPDILVPARPLAVRMRNRFRAALKAADFKLYLTIGAKAWARPWNADARPVGSGEKAFGYLARYFQKTALDGARIVSVTDENVAIRFTDRESGKERSVTLSGEAFLQRFLQHVLPRGFTRVRHFGFLSAAAKARFERIRSLLQARAAPLLLAEASAPCCAACGGRLVFLEILRPVRPRAPPPT